MTIFAQRMQKAAMQDRLMRRVVVRETPTSELEPKRRGPVRGAASATLRASPEIEWETDVYTHGPGTWTQVQWCLQYPRIRRTFTGGSNRVASVVYRVYRSANQHETFAEALAEMRAIDQQQRDVIFTWPNTNSG